jgi:hypothetical protein
MRRLPLLGLAVALVVGAGLAWEALAQQTTIRSPSHTVTNGFFENMGTSWGFRAPNVTFSFGGSPTRAAPQFGGFDAGAGGNVGVAGATRGGNWFFNGNFSQGSRTSNVSQTPMVTVMNGQSGFMSDTSQSPFVVGVIPVVGGFPFGGFFPGASTVQLPTFSMFGVNTSVLVPDNGGALLGGVNRSATGANQFGAPGLRQNRGIGMQNGAANMQVKAQVHDLNAMDELILNGAGAQTPPPRPDAGAQALAASQKSTAGRGAVSVAEAQRQRDAEGTAKNDEAVQYFERGQAAEQQGKIGAAKVYYQMAARRATGEFRQSVLAKLEAMRNAGNVGAVAQGGNP